MLAFEVMSSTAVKFIQHCNTVFKIFIKHPLGEAFCTLVNLSQSPRLSGGNAEEMKDVVFVFEELTVQAVQKEQTRYGSICKAV